MKSTELRVQRAKLVADARAILTAADTAKREPTAEERGQFDTMMGDVDKLADDIARVERLETEERSLAESQGRRTEPVQPGRRPDGEHRGAAIEQKETRPRDTEEYRSAYDRYVRGGLGGLSDAEYRALSAENDVQGGYLVAPQQTVNTLIKAMDNLLWIRRLATVLPVSGAESLGCPTLDADPADADWTSELATGSEDSTTGFGRRELHPRPVAKRLKISRKLLSRMPGAEGLVTQRLAYKFAVTEEKAFLTGDGANKPLGLFTASAYGVSTGRDVSTGNTSTAITMDGLINGLYGLKDQYRMSPSTAWLFHRDAVKMIRKLRSDSGAGAGTGDYLWQPSVQAGQPDRLLNLPVYSSEYAPNTFTSGLYVGMVGDFSNYWIADADTFSIQRLVELYAETNQVGLIGRKETDGMPVLEEAFVRVKLG